MARKHVDLKAAKAARQKKIAIGGAFLLVAVLIFQVPRLMKTLHHSAPAAKSSTSVSTTTTPDATSTSTATPESGPVSNTASAGTTVLTAQLVPAAREGQLATLSSTFEKKDPFNQLITDATSTQSATPPAKAKADKQQVKLKVVPSSKTAGTSSAPASSPAVQPFMSAVISVNGVRWGVGVKDEFPTDAPLFVLKKITKKTAKVSVAGGSLANGAATLTLHKGKAVTLVNTADGTRFTLKLVSTSRTAAAAAPVTTNSGSGATAQAPASTSNQTSTAQTTTTPVIGG